MYTISYLYNTHTRIIYVSRNFLAIRDKLTTTQLRALLQYQSQDRVKDVGDVSDLCYQCYQTLSLTP